MALLQLEMAELHSNIFVAGKNLGPKLQPKMTTGLKINYDRKEKELHVEWNGKTALVPVTNIVSMIVMTKESALEPVVNPIASAGPNPKVTAQYDSPMSHVFAGPGGGKTGQ